MFAFATDLASTNFSPATRQFAPRLGEDALLKFQYDLTLPPPAVGGHLLPSPLRGGKEAGRIGGVFPHSFSPLLTAHRYLLTADC
jgi:hypothetical protein